MKKKDFIFSSYWFCKFVNKFLKGGKRFNLLKFIYNYIRAYKKFSIDFLLLFKEAMEVLRLPMALKKISLKNEVPFYISEYYQYNRGLGWLVKAIKKNYLGKSLMDELFQVVTLSSGSITLKLKKDYENQLYKNRFFKNWLKR